ncbi:MAG: [acyl-carrier-protein] S-malonyltransferase, partial [Pseudomonadota bacterium]
GTFREYLNSFTFDRPVAPVFDNVTGLEIADKADALRDTLTQHLTSPVLWSKSIENMIGGGCSEFIELGFGSTLSRFGFFINRKVSYRSFSDRGDKPI